MSFQLVPTAEGAYTLELANGVWEQTLLDGVGLPLGFGHSLREGHSVFSGYVPPNHHYDLKVTPTEAAHMVAVARGLVEVWRSQQEVWAKATPEERAAFVRMPPTDDDIERVETFAEFAAQSGGFTIT